MPSGTTSGCTVIYAMNDWGSGATVAVTIKNNGSTPINGWTLVWNFFGNQKIINLWNASYTQLETEVAVKNAGYNATIPAGGSVSFGFNINYSGSNVKPTSFVLNGQACQVQ
jgi:cellulase/cellobiase CelA1